MLCKEVFLVLTDDEMNMEHTELFFHTDEHWFSKGNILHHFYNVLLVMNSHIKE